METEVGIRELKAHLSRYLRRVKAGATLVITERGKPIGRLLPIKPDAETRLAELAQVGLLEWSGRKLAPRQPVARPRGKRTVAELLLEDRE